MKYCKYNFALFISKNLPIIAFFRDGWSSGLMNMNAQLSPLISNFEHLRSTRWANQTKKFTIDPKSYTAILLYCIFDSPLSTCQKKWKLKNGPRLPTLPYYYTKNYEKNRFQSFKIHVNPHFFFVSAKWRSHFRKTENN